MHTHKFSYYFTLLAACFLTLLWLPQSYAATAAGQVQLSSGGFTAAQPGAAPRALSRGSSFFSHDVLHTGNGTAQVRFTDGTIVALRPHTDFSVDDYAYQQSKNKQRGGALKYAVTLISGGFRSISGAIAKYNPSAYKVSTNVATIGIRGTEYSLVYDAKDENCGLAAAMQKGSIVITNKGGAIQIGAGSTYKYACVKSADQAPNGETTQPSIFDNDVKIMAVGVSNGRGGDSSSSSPAGTVCIQ